MSDILKPENETQVLEAVQWALSGNAKTLNVVGLGTKRGLGNLVSADVTLDLSGHTGITLYEPEELVMSARAGTH